MIDDRIMLNELLRFSTLDGVKIRFVKSHKEGGDPLALFNSKREELKKWLLWNYAAKKCFKEGDVVVGLVRLSSDKWLLFDVLKITNDLNVYNGIGYESEPQGNYKRFLGRVIIRYKNKAQNLIRNASTVIDQCSVAQILDGEFNQDLFPGYDQVRISWQGLKRVISNDAWKTALENQKGVYLITDTANGKRYVGSAYGENMLYGRWCAYVKNGHGGNKKLKKLDFEYIKGNFSYSILETYKSTTPDDIVLKRESWWKETLLTRNENFGYNDN